MATRVKTKSKSMEPKKKKLKDMSVDEFMSADFDSDSESSKSSDFSKNVSNGGTNQGKPKVKTLPDKKKKKKQKVSQENNEDEDTSKKLKKTKKQMNGNKSTLANTLKDTDPDFYEYLQGEDQTLLQTLEDLSESDQDSDAEVDATESNKGTKSKKVDKVERTLLNMSSGEEDSDNESDDDDGIHVHNIPQKLEVASDDSEVDDEEEEVEKRMQGGALVVTHKIIEQWSNNLRDNASIKVLKQVVAAFHGAVYEASGRSEDSAPSRYIIKGDAIFNGIVRLCLAHVAPALQTILAIPSLTAMKQAISGRNTNSKWAKVKLIVKSYLADILKLLSQLSDSAMVNTILKHIHKLAVLYIGFARIAKNLMKQMIKTWSTGEETSRVLAFLIINKLVQLDREAFLESSIKKMYMAYVSNCKFVSPNTLPLINFMQHSLVEIFSNDESVSYQYAFVYIRQLAIHLRNAMTVKKKNTCQAVYNWQYMHCLGLWVQLLGTFPSEALKPLIYPLTQTIIGTIKLLPIARYYPLRFHCVRLLNSLSTKTSTYIPTLPFLLEIFEQTDFNKRHKAVSIKPFNFAVILKFSKPQLVEKSFKDGLIDQLYEHLMESYNIHAHSVGFPELIIPSLLNLKDFMKKCKIANYCKQIKQIIEKIEEQSKFIVQRRKRSSLKLDDLNGLRSWEEEIETSPLRKYYTSWRKLRNRELIYAIANKDAVSGAGFEMPTREAKKKPAHKATDEERKDFSKLFEELSESESEDETRFMLKGERPKTTEESGEKKKKSKKRKLEKDEEEMDSDDYSDLDDDDWATLDKSASEGEEEDDDDDIEIDDESDDDDEEDMDNEDDDSEDDEDDEEVEESDSESESKNKKSDSKSKNIKQKGGSDKTTTKKATDKPSPKTRTNTNGKMVEDGDGSDDLVEDFDLSNF